MMLVKFSDYTYVYMSNVFYISAYNIYPYEKINVFGGCQVFTMQCKYLFINTKDIEAFD